MTPSSSSDAVTRGHLDSRKRQILAAQVRLLYSNTNVGVGVTLAATVILARLQWYVAPHFIILGWCLYMFLVSVGRFALRLLYQHSAPSSTNASKWILAFDIGAGLAGAGWGAAGIVLYPETSLGHQIVLIFIIGGMVIGAATMLAATTDAFVSFILPAALTPTLRLMLQGDETHLAMGLLAGIFTCATLFTTWRIHLTIISSLNLQFENRDLVEDLQAAKNHAEALNEQLEVRVQKRTAELQHSTERLQAEIKQREQMEDELLRGRKLEALGVLAGGIAHDFNNFLTIVQGNVEMAKMQLDPNEPVQTILEQTSAACQRATFLSSQLLTLAKGGAPVRRLTSVAKLIIDAVDLARAGAQANIEVNIAEDLWFAEVDPGQIGQVLHNILLNARQAMPEGGTIEVGAQNVFPAPGMGARVRISIRDYGHAIPADVLPRIFDPYFTTKPGGSGLGLATAFAIVTKHRGNISVKSTPGHGTVFTIDLPASEERPATLPAIVGPVQAGTGRLLVMDDEEALRKLLESLLTKLGYEVQLARDGAEAIALYEKAKSSGSRFDAALLDLTVIGGMGGLEAAARLKESDPSLKLIVSSGYSDAPVTSDFRKYGFDDVIPKPWTVAQLGEVFRRVLGSDKESQLRSAGNSSASTSNTGGAAA